MITLIEVASETVLYSPAHNTFDVDKALTHAPYCECGVSAPLATRCVNSECILTPLYLTMDTAGVDAFETLFLRAADDQGKIQTDSQWYVPCFMLRGKPRSPSLCDCTALWYSWCIGAAS